MGRGRSIFQAERRKVSIIVPAHDAAQTLPLCLDAISRSTIEPYETLVICDGCTDETADIARQYGARTIEYAERRGASYARNVGGAAAHGDIFFFIDSDCVALPDTVAIGAQTILDGEHIIFGSYSRDTRVSGFLTKFKNLQHHYTHQHGADHQTTFWSGCGAVTRKVFEDTGGFDVDIPSCEDIEFGSAAIKQGYEVRLIRTMQGEHLKQYDLLGLVRSDLLQRAAPWTQLICSGRVEMGALNTDWKGRVSVAATGLVILGLLGSLFWLPGLAVATAAGLTLVAANLGLLRLLRHELGWALSIVSVGSLLLHYSICGLGYVMGHFLPRLPRSRAVISQYSWVESGLPETYPGVAAKTSP